MSSRIQRPVRVSSLHENILDDVAPIDVTGSRIVRPSRRGLLRCGGGLLALALVPTACEPEEVELTLGVLLLLANVAFGLDEPVTGDAILSNTTDSTMNLGAIFSLIQSLSMNAVSSYDPDGIWSLPPGEWAFPYGDLYAIQTGKHLVEGSIGGGKYQTDQFDIN